MENKTSSSSSPTLWTTIATARAYEKAARAEFKRLVTSRPDVFGESFVTSYGAVHAYGLAEGEELPADGKNVKARAKTAAGLVASLADHRKSLTISVDGIAVTGTPHRLEEMHGIIADILADIEEAHTIGVTARIKPYAEDITADGLASLVTEARHTAAQARANGNDEYADDVIMLLNDLRQTIWGATDGRPTIKHVDAAAIGTAVNALTLAIEDI